MVERLPLPLAFFALSWPGQLAGYRVRLYTERAALCPASVDAPIWNTQPIISFFLSRVTLKGIEVVTFRDGIAAALVVIGILVMRWA